MPALTPEHFRLFADALPEPMLLVTGSGHILAGNRALAEHVATPLEKLPGQRLAEFVVEPADEVAHYLRLCARSRQPVLGALCLHRDGTRLSCRAEGSLVRPSSDGAEPLVLLRLRTRGAAGEQFVALNQRIEQLGREVQRRKQAEAAAREDEERLRVTLRSIGDAVIVTDPEGRVTSLNPVAATLTGWSEEQARGHALVDVFDIVNEDTREPVDNPALRALREGVIVGLANHTVLIARDGAERCIDDSAAPIRDAAGRIVGAVLVFRDISARRQTEAALRRSEQRLRLIVDSASEYAIITFDRAGRITSWNSGARNLFGYEEAEIIGRPGDELFLPEHRQRGVPEAEQETALRDGRAQDERWHVRKDGSRFWAHGLMMPLRDDGAALGFLKIVRDMTEARLAEQRLRESEGQFRALAETIPQLAWTARPDGHIFWYNRRWYDYTGTTPEQMEGWGWQAVHDPDVLPTVLERWRSSVANGEPFDMVFPLRGADGRFRPFLTRVVPLRDRDGRVVQWFGTNTDISEQQAMAQALREEDRRKDEFLATLAHELRNPLAPLRHGLHVMQLAGADPAAIAQARDMMARQLQHLVRLVDDLLDLSRISQGKITLRTERVAIATAVSAALEACEPLIREPGHELIVALPPGPLYVEGDRTRLAQVLSNLLSNSAKYSERGSRIWLTVEQAGDTARITVRDTGVGIPAHMLPRVFDVFTQVDPSLEKANGGLGVGLTIVKRLIELHGGTVEARSEGPGRGSEFVVCLPLSEPPAAAPARDGRNGPPTGATASHRVLVVDDNVDAADSLAMMLKILAHDVRCAYDGSAAVEAAAAFRPDLILLDIGMPRVNGYEACRRIREQPGGREIVIVALTGWGQEEDRRRSREAGFDHHLVKPVEPEALEQLLGTLG